MSESGFNTYYKFVLGAGVKARPYDRTVGRAKTVTSNLPLLSVLAHVMLFFSHVINFHFFCSQVA
jgi:hypothetical protein